MTDYINIKGQNIEVVASDPSNPTSGQIWYNSTSQTLKGQGFAAGSWASATSMGTARSELAGCGTQTAALAFGGLPVTGATEEYDGSTLTANPTGLNTARAYLAGCGTQTAALAFGGSPNYLSGGTATELYDGSTWTSNPTGLNTARNYLGSAGTQTAALGFGGLPTTAATEEWTGPGAVVTKTITTS